MRTLTFSLLAALALTSCQSETSLSSPNGRTVIHVDPDQTLPTYTVVRDGDTLIYPSPFVTSPTEA